MNWSRTKNILIFALIITNIFLIFIYFDEGAGEPVELDDELEILLNNKNIFLSDEIKTFPRLIDSIIVKYDIYKLDEIVKNMLGENVKISDGLVHNNKYRMNIENRNELIVELMEYPEKENNSGRPQGLEIANSYLVKHGFLDDNVKLDSFKVEDNLLVYEYKNEYEGKFLRNSYMIVKINNEEVVYFKRKWLSVIEVRDKKPIIPIEKALYRMANQVSDEGKIEVESVKLGYALESDILTQNVVSGEALPFYEFKLDNGNEIYIEALNN